MAKRVTARDHERMMAEGKPTYSKDVQANVNRLQGKSRSDLVPDSVRGAASALGHGTGSKKITERGR